MSVQRQIRVPTEADWRAPHTTCGIGRPGVIEWPAIRFAHGYGAMIRYPPRDHQLANCSFGTQAAPAGQAPGNDDVWSRNRVVSAFIFCGVLTPTYCGSVSGCSQVRALRPAERWWLCAGSAAARRWRTDQICQVVAVSWRPAPKRSLPYASSTNTCDESFE